jgi:hypothetical protein
VALRNDYEDIVQLLSGVAFRAGHILFDGGCQRTRIHPEHI